jgi:hypothetical protein
MGSGRRPCYLVLFVALAGSHGSAPALFARSGGSQAAAVAQSPPQAPPPAARPGEKAGDKKTPTPDGQETEEKEHGLERLRIRVEGDELRVTGPGPGPAARGFYPLIGEIVSGSGLSAGLDYHDLQPHWSPLGFDAAAEVSWFGFQLYRLQVGYLEHRDTTETLQAVDAKVTSLFNDHAVKSRGVAAYASARYLHYPAAVFYGVGSGTHKVDRTDYLLLGALVDGVVQYQFTRTFGVAGRVGLLAPSLGRGSDEALQARFGPSTAPGLADVPHFVTTGMAAAVDARDQPADPHHGSFVGTAVWLFDEIGGTEYTFVRVTGDARWYHPLVVPQGVVALRALASDERPTAGGEVPFYLQQTLGGDEILRGFAPYRFRDRALAAVSAEYRLRVSRWLELGPFADAGTVAPSFAHLALHNVEWSGGVRAGLRYKGRILFSVGWGHCREGDRLFFSTGSGF